MYKAGFEPIIDASAHTSPRRVAMSPVPAMAASRRLSRLPERPVTHIPQPSQSSVLPGQRGVYALLECRRCEQRDRDKQKREHTGLGE